MPLLIIFLSMQWHWKLRLHKCILITGLPDYQYKVLLNYFVKMTNL